MAKFPFQDRLEQMQRGLDHIKRYGPEVASKVARDEFILNFRAQGLRVAEGKVEKWKARQRPYRSAAARKRARPILVNTAKLRDDMQLDYAPGMAGVVSSVVYARIHNRGGRIKGQMRAWATNRRSRKTRLRPSGSPAYMPARPFMVSTPLLMQKIAQALHEEVVMPAMDPKAAK